MSEELIWHTYSYTFPAAFSLLPGAMDSPEARAEMLAIGLHESNFASRQQGGTSKKAGKGPAKSFWQFELGGGVTELLETKSVRPILTHVLDVLRYPEWTAAAVHEAMEHNDTLAAVAARLLLWKDPRLMPKRHEGPKGYAIYLARWRPNPEAAAAHAGDWPLNFAKAYSIVEA